MSEDQRDGEITAAERIKRMMAEKAKKHLEEVRANAAEEGVTIDPNAEGVKEIPNPSLPSTAKQESVEALSKIRIYRSRVPSSRYIFENGKEIFFTEGWYETSDPDEIRQLDKVANKVPTIYTDAHEREIIAAILEARKKGFTGTVAAMMTEQLTIEQRVAAIRHQGNSAALNLPGGAVSAVPALLVPPVDFSGTQVDTEATLRAAIARAAKPMASQSNSQ